MQIVVPADESDPQIHRPVADISPVREWIRNLGLEGYGDIFAREEIDWDTLQWLTEEVCFILNCLITDPFILFILQCVNQVKLLTLLFCGT